MENKKQGFKKKAFAALKSLSGRSTKRAKSHQTSSSLSSIDATDPQLAGTADQPEVLSEQATDASSVSRLIDRSGVSKVASPESPDKKNKGADEPPNPSSLTPSSPRMSSYISELNKAINEFRKNYVKFAKANSEYILIDDELENAIPDIATVGDVKQIAKLFEQNVTKTIRINERKKLLRESHWLTQVGHFFSKLYPVAKLSCSLMGAVVEVVVHCVVTINT
jgi:hypothetical protein